MLTREDVLEAVGAWQNAGLRILIRSEEQGRKYVDAMFATYGAVDKEAWLLVTRELAHGKTWPRYSDIDELLEKYKVQKRQEESKQAVERSRWKGRTPGMLDGETKEQFAERTARRRFREASDETIRKMVETSLLTLIDLGIKDAVCTACRHGEMCSTCGHMPVPKIEQDISGGFAYLTTCVSREVCYKYPDKRERRVQK